MPAALPDALLLSGGGSLGWFHVGVARAWHEAHGAWPQMIAGSSAGSMVAACIGALQDPGPAIDAFFNDDDGFFADASGETLARVLRRTLGDATFGEAHACTGRVLHIPVLMAGGARLPLVLNYLTAPNVVVWSAVLASTAMPGWFSPKPLVLKTATRTPSRVYDLHHTPATWIDGALGDELPTHYLRTAFDVHRPVLSLANPLYVTPVSWVRRLASWIGAHAILLAANRAEQAHQARLHGAHALFFPFLRCPSWIFFVFRDAPLATRIQWMESGRAAFFAG